MAADNLKRLPPTLIETGKPTPVSIYDRNGHLLLGQGHVISTEKQIARIIEAEFYVPPGACANDPQADAGAKSTKPASPFAQYYPLLLELERTLGKLIEHDPSGAERLSQFSDKVRTMVSNDADASLALIHVYSVDPGAYEQALFYSIMGAVAAQTLQMNDAETRSLVNACLSANISLIQFVDRLNRSSKALSDSQRAIIRRHPELSARTLEACGIEDTGLIRAVEQHHEVFDGSGYPQGLSGESIEPGAKIIGLIERYIAMITRRAYHSRRKSALEAAGELIHGFRHDPHVAQFERLAAALSPYPPGTLAQLSNGEKVIVIRRHRKSYQVRALGRDDRRYASPLLREVDGVQYAMDKALTPSEYPALNLASLWGYEERL